MGGFSLLLHCSHLISIGRWLADMSLRLACLLIGGRRRRGRGRIGVLRNFADSENGGGEAEKGYRLTKPIAHFPTRELGTSTLASSRGDSFDWAYAIDTRD